MRVAIVEVIGYLAAELAAQAQLDDVSDRAQLHKQINGLFELLLERAMDVSSYVRTKVLSVLSKLCDLSHKFPKQRLAVTQVAVAALEDKAASVRKGAVALLVKLLLTHPYGKTHGGYLELDIWEAEYQTIKAELAKVEGTVGNAVRDDEGEDEDDQDDEEEDGEGEEGQEDEQDGDEQPKKKKKKRYQALFTHDVQI